MTERRLRVDLLRSVSRSFYLSLRLLPQAVREPISLAYLLARATDTIADTSAAPIAFRLRLLALLAGRIAGENPSETLAEVRASFTPLQTNSEERELIEALPACIAWLGTLAVDDREDVRAVLAKIIRGQTLDLDRFGEATELKALKSAAELDEYTYLVAGCVGEFWTAICTRKLPAFSDRPEPEMRALGIAFGQALQLTNILRDAGSDLRAGRCYLPREELERAGLQPENLLGAPAAADSVLAKWRERAESGLREGIEYASAIRSVRARIATALPALIGLRTIELLAASGANSLTVHVKMPRREVRALVLRTLLALASPSFLRSQSALRTSQRK